MGSLWSDMTSVVSHNSSALVSSLSDARAAERNEYDYPNGKVKILNTNCSLIKFCVFDPVSKGGLKYSRTSTVIRVKAISDVYVSGVLNYTQNGAHNAIIESCFGRVSTLDQFSLKMKNISIPGAGSI